MSHHFFSIVALVRDVPAETKAHYATTLLALLSPADYAETKAQCAVSLLDPDYAWRDAMAVAEAFGFATWRLRMDN